MHKPRLFSKFFCNHVRLRAKGSISYSGAFLLLARSECDPMLLTCVGLLRTFAGSTMWQFPFVHQMLLVGVHWFAFVLACRDV
jgi:hypothetical protein